MGYSTEFEGAFEISPALTPAEIGQLSALTDGRHDDSRYPSLYCQWDVSPDGRYLAWDGGEKFYNYVEWAQLIIDRFLRPRGHTLSGAVRYRGESFNDMGTLVVEGGKIKRARF